jgi:ABC-type uncharacterized transport system auxiliary subunit
MAILSGCVSPQPPMQEFILDTNTSLPSFNQNKCLDKTIKISRPFSDASLFSLSMKYTENNLQQYSYSKSQWAKSPNAMINADIVHLVRNLNIFQSVQIAKSRTKNDLILETDIEKFMQYYDNKDTSSYANIVITFSLINAKTHVVIGTKTFSSKVNAATLDAKGGVEALNAALQNIEKEAAIWLKGICK